MIKIEIKIMEFYEMLKTHRNFNIDWISPYFPPGIKHKCIAYNILLDQHKSSHDTISAYCFGFDVANYSK